jgi:hypothetical protein
MAVYTAIDDPELYFQTKLYTGTGSAASITLDGDEDMQPDLVWFKKRSSTESHYVYDAVRGVTKEIYANSTAAEDTDANSLTGFNSDGFSIGNANQLSENTETMVAWCWKESATAGFDIVSYTGNGSARTISHSLSAVPKMYIIKNLGEADSWQVYHAGNTSAPETDFLQLNETGATTDSAARFNDTAPTSSVFSVGDHVTVNKNTINYIAYAFASKQGFSKFGSYTGNGNADGTFINTGFRPALVIAKRTDSTANWYMMTAKISDSGGGNPLDRPLFANDSQAENDGDNNVDLLSNGFKIRGSGSAQNGDGATYIYMAFAEQPFVNSNGVPCNAR